MLSFIIFIMLDSLADMLRRFHLRFSHCTQNVSLDLLGSFIFRLTTGHRPAEIKTGE